MKWQHSIINFNLQIRLNWAECKANTDTKVLTAEHSAMLSLDSMTYHRRVWFNTGMWHEPGQPRWYIWYTIFLVIFFYVLFTLFIIVQLPLTQSITEFTDTLRILPTAAIGIKAALIANNRTRIVQLFDVLKQMDSFVQLPGHKDMIRQQVKESNNLLLFIRCDYFVSVGVYFLVAVLSGTDLMFLAWYPVDYANSAVWFYSINTYQCINALFIAYVLTSADFYGIVLYQLLGGHLDVLVLQLAIIGHKEASSLSSQQTMSEAVERMNTNEEELLQCIKYHALCSRFVSPIIFTFVFYIVL